jgi:predicted DNA binding CopG/RHH family protein
VASESEKQARTSLRLPAELYKQARILALERGVTFQQLVETLLSNEVSRARSSKEISTPDKGRK